MIDTETRKAINGIGERLGKHYKIGVEKFTGAITFNYFDGNYVSFNVKQTVKRNNLNEGVRT